jgi:CDP-2,3-bis-(O-geranylgeranyl)-sn-glycerol synthase
MAAREERGIIKESVFVLWFFLPAGLGNATPIVAAKLPPLAAWSFPLDGYATFRGKRIFGEHKTVRGLLSGLLVGIATAGLQVRLYRSCPRLRQVIPLDYTAIHPLLFGALASLGALSGDALKSFFKRQVGIPPGESWIPFDQVDDVLGGIAGTARALHLGRMLYLLLPVIWTVLHPLFNDSAQP